MTAPIVSAIRRDPLTRFDLNGLYDADLWGAHWNRGGGQLWQRVAEGKKRKARRCKDTRPDELAWSWTTGGRYVSYMFHWVYRNDAQHGRHL